MWQEPDRDSDDLDRDSRVMRYASSKGVGRARLAAASGNNHALGGALQRLTIMSLGPAREDEVASASIPGRSIAADYARYYAPGVNPGRDYLFYSGQDRTRVAVPRSSALSEPYVRQLLTSIAADGPGPVGYVRIGDTVVPASLGPGDRAALAGYARRAE